MEILQADWSIPGHMTFSNGAYWLKIAYWLDNIITYCSASWCYYCDVNCTIVMSYCTIVWLKCHSGATMVFDITIWRNNSSTMPQTVEQGMLENYYGESNNIWPVCFNLKQLTYNKANTELWCWTIWALWIFGNNIDLSFAPSTLLPQIHKTPHFLIQGSYLRKYCILLSAISFLLNNEKW